MTRPSTAGTGTGKLACPEGPAENELRGTDETPQLEGTRRSSLAESSPSRRRRRSGRARYRDREEYVWRDPETGEEILDDDGDPQLDDEILQHDCEAAGTDELDGPAIPDGCDGRALTEDGHNHVMVVTRRGQCRERSATGTILSDDYRAGRGRKRDDADTTTGGARDGGRPVPGGRPGV